VSANSRGSAVRFLASLLVMGCVAYATVLFRWTYQPCSDAAYNVDRLNQQEALAWLLGVNALAVLFILTRNVWVPVALGLLGAVAFAVACGCLVFIAIGECRVAGWDLSPFFVAFFGGSTLMIGAVVSLVVKAVRFFAARVPVKLGVRIGGARFEIGDLLAALAFVASVVATLLILVNGLNWADDVLFSRWAFLIIYASAGAMCVAALLALRELVTKRQH